MSSPHSIPLIIRIIMVLIQMHEHLFVLASVPSENQWLRLHSTVVLVIFNVASILCCRAHPGAQCQMRCWIDVLNCPLRGLRSPEAEKYEALVSFELYIIIIIVYNVGEAHSGHIIIATVLHISVYHEGQPPSLTQAHRWQLQRVHYPVPPDPQLLLQGRPAYRKQLRHLQWRQ